MTKLRKKLTEKTRKFGAEVRRRHSTGLTPESEVCYEDVPKSFPSDWFDESDDFEPKKEAPVRAHKEFKKFRRLLERNAIKSFITFTKGCLSSSRYYTGLVLTTRKMKQKEKR